MISIDSSHVTPEIVALFDFTQPTMPRAFNVLEGLNRGQILVDDPARPTFAVVRDIIYGTLYFGGQTEAAQVASLVEAFRQQGEVGIAVRAGDPLNEMIPIDPDYDGKSMYFLERSQEVSLQDLVDRLPAEFKLCWRDEELFRRSFDYELTLRGFGTLENVMRHALAYTVLHGDAVACEAGTGAPTHGLIEVGVTTAEAYRARGLATVACARLIQECEERGYRTWWDCAVQNIPSQKLAERLGYRNREEYRYVWWRSRV